MNTTKSSKNTQNNLIPKSLQEYIFREIERQIKSGEAFGKRSLKREKITTYKEK